MATTEKAPATSAQDATPTNPRGIPFAPFVDNVEDYVATRQDVEPTLRSFQEMISKYQFMEMNLQRRMGGLKDKIPDIQKTLDTVKFLKLRKDEIEPIESTFELNETLYAKANIPPTDEVYIWLGANVMLSYPVDEAETLLSSKLSTAKTSLSNCEEDLDFLREQITTMEVAIARVYNWEVVQKRKDKATEDEEKKQSSKESDDQEASRRPSLAGGGTETTRPALYRRASKPSRLRQNATATDHGANKELNKAEYLHDALDTRTSNGLKRRDGAMLPASRGALTNRKDVEANQPVAELTTGTILRKVLGSESDSLHWKRKVAEARSLRLPIILLQMMMREEAQRTGDGSLLELLPDDREWRRLLDLVCKTGYTKKQLDEYCFILQGGSDDERCRRLLALGTPGPMFLFTFLLRSSSRLTDVPTLAKLIDSCHVYYAVRQQRQRRQGPESTAAAALTEKALSLGQDKFDLTMRLLTRQCLRLEPRLIVKVAEVAARHLQGVASYAEEPRKLYLVQCEVFNKCLRIFRPQADPQSVQRSLPNAYFWEAQRTLLAVSDSLEKPLLLDRGGFRAIREVLAGQPKNHTEVHSSSRHAPTWPPYLQPGDGMDERADPEENWSRTVSAGMLMQEAGFAKDEHDDALDILQGMTTDGSPTIQQRALMRHGRHVGVWEASIRATRNAQEAWERFQNAPEGSSTKPGPQEYAAMLEKLVLREADAGSRLQPGDKALNFATHHEANLAEFERARLRPPSVAQLYHHMRLNGVKPRDNGLRILVANAESLDTAHRYLRESTERGRVVRALMADEPEPESLRAVPMGLFAAYIQACSRAEGKRGGRQLMRAVRFAETRLAGDQSRWGPYVWGLILKNLSQHHRALRMSLSEQVDMFLHVVDRIDRSHGVQLATFVQLAKCIRKATRREVVRLLADLGSGETTKRNPLRQLYDVQATAAPTSADEHRTKPHSATARTPLFLLRTAAARMKEIFHDLVDRENKGREFLDVQSVGPLERISARMDPVRSDHVHEYVLSLAFVGEFGEMARTLQWAAEQWGQEDVVEAMLGLDEPPAHGDFFEALCAFRLLAAPMLDRTAVESVRAATTGLPLGWTWPDDEAVAAYAEMQHDESMAALRGVLDWTRARQAGGRGDGAEPGRAANQG
ncbi:prefoldin subunit 3 [Purpureocillium lavendulum]|uniref:Prefoldin subunit 3 n=1 Tax=Purpureocillium lavendulum TaxID=1247861 RepID=A0AB34FQQ5_9HYPO|nr:prefoldin subunit 3 [Purpureocillium lavendulum]